MIRSVHKTVMPRTLTKIGIDGVTVVLSILLAFFIRFDGHIPASIIAIMRHTVLPIALLRMAGVSGVPRYRTAWRYVGLNEVGLIATSTVLSTALIAALFVFGRHEVPAGVVAIDALLNLCLLCGARVCVRGMYPILQRRWGPDDGEPRVREPRNILIVGAGTLGEQVARAASRLAFQGWSLVGFVDDDPSLHGRRIHGRPVFGPLSSLPAILHGRHVDEVLVAVANIPGPKLRSIVTLCEDSQARLSLIPRIDQLVEGVAPVWQRRAIRLEDLLEREPIQLDTEEVRSCLQGQRVLVTGAGGSIGSEICRQVAALGPEVIILLGRGENSIFEAVNRLKSESNVPTEAVIGCIQDQRRMRRVFEQYRPTIVFHAAAHKHVPLMEAHPPEAILNNVVGTANVASVAHEFGVSKFVLISTDKAVNPTSVMGATKRIAEMVIRAKALNSRTTFVAVRFGNVLGSRGSVVPTMQRQIEQGGPVTVTHPEVTRYFMTIPEAVQLVLQAGAMGRSGEVFVLNMGTPIRIMDLARNLIRLTGRVPDKDIPIQITGLRPGEKLYEELMTAEEGLTATRNSLISVTKGQIDSARVAHVDQIVDALKQAASDGDSAAVRRLLKQAIPSYTLPAPSPVDAGAERQELERPLTVA